MLPASRYLAIDTETTGFHSDARIVEIACVLFEHGEPIKEWSSLIRPVGVDWESEKIQEALAVSKLTPADFEGKPTFMEVFPTLFTHLRSARVWTAHNVPFDMRMLDNEFRILKNSLFPIQPQEGWLCTLSLSRRLHSGVKGHKMDQVAARWGVTPGTSHRAPSDALTCGRILSAMSKGDLPADAGWIYDPRVG